MAPSRSGEAPHVFEVVHQVWVLSKANSMKKKFGSRTPLFFSTEPSKSRFLSFFGKNLSHVRKCGRNFWQKFLSKFLFHGRLATYPIIFRFKSWSDRIFLGGATEPFRTTKLAFLDPKKRLKNPLVDWYFNSIGIKFLLGVCINKFWDWQLNNLVKRNIIYCRN